MSLLAADRGIYLSCAHLLFLFYNGTLGCFSTLFSPYKLLLLFQVAIVIAEPSMGFMLQIIVGADITSTVDLLLQVKKKGQSSIWSKVQVQIHIYC